MKKILFHGSQFIINTPAYGKGAKNNDYGRGFYCTENAELAKEWACSANTNGYINKYELITDNLNILKLNDAPYNLLNWLAVLAANRTYWQNSSIAETAKQYLHDYFLVDLSGYDIIIGYRADDSYFSFAQDFVANAISYKQLSEAMKLGKLGEQVVLKSEKAFEILNFISSENVLCEEYFPKKAARDKSARQEYRRNKKQQTEVNDLFMIDIMRGGMRNGDSRLL